MATLIAGTKEKPERITIVVADLLQLLPDADKAVILFRNAKDGKQNTIPVQLHRDFETLSFTLSEDALNIPGMAHVKPLLINSRTGQQVSRKQAEAVYIGYTSDWIQTAKTWGHSE